MGHSSAAVSGLFLAAGGVRTRPAFSFFFPAAGEVLGFGVEVVLGPLAAFFFFVPLFSVSPYKISPGKQSLRMKYKSDPPRILCATTSGMWRGLSLPITKWAGAAG
jgi:hypothetical protein